MSIPNLFRSSKWRVSFSNIPSSNDFDDMKLYDYYVKSLYLPSYNVDEVYSEFKNQRMRYPTTKINENLQPINISFKCSENLENYLNLFEYMQQMKYGQNVTPEYIKDNTVNKINLIILDNQKRDIYKIEFTNCFLLALSNLDLVQGIDNEITFSTTFSYQEILKEALI